MSSNFSPNAINLREIPVLTVEEILQSAEEMNAPISGSIWTVNAPKNNYYVTDEFQHMPPPPQAKQSAKAKTSDDAGVSAPITITVRSGDTLSKLARKYGVSVEDIKNANGLKNDTIRVGDKLTIPPKAPTQAQAGGSRQGAGNNSGNKQQVITVASGDTLSKLARKYGVSVEDIKNANGLKNDTIRVGDKLIIPPKATNQASTSSGAQSSSSPNTTGTAPTPNEAGAAKGSPQVDSTNGTQGTTAVEPTPAVTPNKQSKDAEQPAMTPAQKEAAAINRAAVHARKKESYKGEAYKCQSGVWTVGYGHTGPDVKKGTTMTLDKAEETLQKELKAAHDGIKKALGEEAYNKIDERHLSVLINLAFNSGINAVTKSEYFKLIKEGKYDEAQAKMDAVYSNGKVSNGLLIRRAQDMILWGDGVLTPAAEKRLLDLLNESFGTKYKTFKEAAASMRAELKKLENADPKIVPLSAKEKSKLQRLNDAKSLSDAEKEERDKLLEKQEQSVKLKRYRNIQELFTLIEKPQEYLAQFNAEVSKKATV